MLKPNRGKRPERVGITGIGQDYTVYRMSGQEKVLWYLAGFAAGFGASFVMFEQPLVSLIIGVVTGFAAQPVARNHLFEKRRKTILLQFREMLDSLSSSFSSGKNTVDAFADTLNDMRLAFGEDAPITREASIIVSGLASNYTIENLLKDLSARTDIQDINSFADTFAVCNRMGGNLKRIVTETKDIISDKIGMELEIQTILASNKNEMNIMTAMPFVMILAMKLMGESALLANTPVNVAVKMIAVGMFIVAYIIGKRIIDIKL